MSPLKIRLRAFVFPMTHPSKERHRKMLGVIDKWFSGVRIKHSEQMQCGRGCSLCCYGLFDISFPDALMVAEGLSRLPDDTRAALAACAA